MTQYFSLSQYFQCKQADIDCMIIKVSKSPCLQKSRSGGGGAVVVGRVYVFGFYIHVLCETCNLGFKGLLDPHVLENLENLENYGCPGMSWKSLGQTQFFRLSWNSGILIRMSWKSPGIPLVHGIWFSMAVFQ